MLLISPSVVLVQIHCESLQCFNIKTEKHEINTNVQVCISSYSEGYIAGAHLGDSARPQFKLKENWSDTSLERQKVFSQYNSCLNLRNSSKRVSVSMPKHIIASMLTENLWLLSACLTPAPYPSPFQLRGFPSLPPAVDSYITQPF